jgi:DNA replication protein DnaC
MNHEIPDLEPLLKRLSLANTRRTYRKLIRRAERQSWSYGQFLSVLITEEIAHRRQTRINRLTHRAGFPFLKTIEEFDFSFQSSLRLNLLGSALSPDFITEGRTILLIGKPGRGKTHLAVAIAYQHILNSFEVLFVTAAKMIDELSGAASAGRFNQALARYTHPALLVVDELGYLSYGNDAANMLFHVVNDRYLGGRSMIFTTNKKLTDWGGVLHDDDLAAAIVDRLLERGRIIPLDGPSMRSRHLVLDDETDSMLRNKPDRISGNHRTDFPEPTLTKRCNTRPFSLTLIILSSSFGSSDQPD